jgi:hypothetical protein
MARLSALAALTLLAQTPACAESSARIVETQPSTEAALGRNESFYVRIGYTTDEPISLWARPYFNGKPVENALSNASAEYSGTGEALGWFALNAPGQVDEIRIRAGGGKPYREWELSTRTVQLSWTESTPSATPAAPWVDERRAIARQRNAAPTNPSRQEARRSSVASCSSWSRCCWRLLRSRCGACGNGAGAGRLRLRFR